MNPQLLLSWRQAGVIEGITPRMLSVRLYFPNQKVGRLESG
jgi:hypothetical protein